MTMNVVTVGFQALVTDLVLTQQAEGLSSDLILTSFFVLDYQTVQNCF